MTSEQKLINGYQQIVDSLTNEVELWTNLCKIEPTAVNKQLKGRAKKNLKKMLFCLNYVKATYGSK